MIILIIIIAILASYLRLDFLFLKEECLHDYESWFLQLANMKITGFFNLINILKIHSVHQPLYVHVLHFWMRLFKETDFSVKLLSAIINVLLIIAIPLIAFFNDDLLSRDAALLTAFIIAISPIHIFFSRLVTPYSLFILLSFLATMSFLIFLKKGKLRYTLFYLCSILLLFYTLVFGLIILFVHDLFALFVKKNIKKWIIVNLAIIMLCLPIMLLYYPYGIFGLLTQSVNREASPKLINPSAWEGPHPRPNAVKQTFLDYSAGNYLLLFLFLLLILYGLTKEKQNVSLNLFYVLSFIAPPIIMYLLSIYTVSMYKVKALLFISIPFFILVAKGISHLNRVIQIFILSIIVLVSFSKLFAPSFSQPVQNWKALVSDINRYRQSSIVIFYPSYTSFVFNRYYKGKFYTVDTVYNVKNILSHTQKNDTLLLVMKWTPPEHNNIFNYVKENCNLLFKKEYKSRLRYGLKGDIRYYLFSGNIK